MNVKKVRLNDTEIYAFSNWVFVDGVPGPGLHRWPIDVTLYEFLYSCLSLIQKNGGTILYKGEVAEFLNLSEIMLLGQLYASDLVTVARVTLTVDEFDHYRNEW